MKLEKKLIALSAALNVAACDPQEWGESIAYDPEAICEIDVFNDLVRPQIAEVLENDGFDEDHTFLVGQFPLNPEPEFENVLSGYSEIGMVWYPSESVNPNAFIVDDEGWSYWDEIREGYACDDGTVVYDFKPSSLYPNLLVVAQCDFTLQTSDAAIDATSSGTFFGTCVGDIYKSCPFDSTLDLEDYADVCTRVASIQGETPIRLGYFIE